MFRHLSWILYASGTSWFYSQNIHHRWDSTPIDTPSPWNDIGQMFCLSVGGLTELWNMTLLLIDRSPDDLIVSDKTTFSMHTGGNSMLTASHRLRLVLDCKPPSLRYVWYQVDLRRNTQTFNPVLVSIIPLARLYVNDHSRLSFARLSVFRISSYDRGLVVNPNPLMYLIAFWKTFHKIIDFFWLEPSEDRIALNIYHRSFPSCCTL